MTLRRFFPYPLFAVPFLFSLLFFTGCVALFGWSIEAPGRLSGVFYEQVERSPYRVALFLPDETIQYISKDRGSKVADPQTYFVGEAFAPMSIEAFHTSFEEFLFFEREPTPELLQNYDIDYLVVLFITDFQNTVKLKYHQLALRTEAMVFDQELNLVARIEADGLSKGNKTFAKKGGPELNLNAAIENNLVSLISFFQGVLENDQVA